MSEYRRIHPTVISQHCGSVFSLCGLGFRIRSQEMLYASDNFMFMSSFVLSNLASSPNAYYRKNFNTDIIVSLPN
jgi:hypothetical protein